MENRFDSIFHENSSYVEELFARYNQDPNSVGSEWKAYFSGFREGFSIAVKNLDFGENTKGCLDTGDHADAVQFELRVASLVHAWMTRGHLLARVDPLGRPPYPVESLSPAFFQLSVADLERPTRSGVLVGLGVLTVKSLLQKLEERFAGSVGAEIEHVEDPAERLWLHAALADIQSTQVDKSTQLGMYRELAFADAFEKAFSLKYVGKKRFGIEGADAQYPALESFLDEASRLGVEECVLATAHRGRLNLLVHVVGKPIEKLLAEWEGLPHEGLRGDCDVKYHYGYESVRTTRGGKSIKVSMPFNPSHLEYVSSVALGECRARQARSRQADTSRVAAVILHGDAAIAGQGIVFETAQMMTLKGYGTGGTVHIVINNQVGFTTDPVESRSSRYCSDIAQVTKSPVFHVNSNDIDSLHGVMVLAARYRARFQRDIYIDLVCFRRNGHNETDEPAFTQPLLYKLIKEKPAPYEVYGKNLVLGQRATESELQSVALSAKQHFSEVFEKFKQTAPVPMIEQFSTRYEDCSLRFVDEKEMLSPFHAPVSEESLKQIAQKICSIPEGFQINPKLARIIVSERTDMALGHKPVDFGMAELLAYGSLLEQGYSVRLSGEDVQRGTFSHRHAVLVDSENGDRHNALGGCVPQDSLARVEIINSLLSEEAALGYEYGYAVHQPRCLTVWEAQFGDFINGAQVIIDQFIAAGESKWRQSQGLVLLLPHGFEGMGAEHSSARLERFLQLSAEGNMQVCSLTNAAQTFHALRRQVLRDFRKPLIIMTPKSFLRNPRTTVFLSHLAKGQFEEILDDPRPLNPDAVERVLLCSGKIALDLFDALEKEDAVREKVAILRVEQIYPFHKEKMSACLSRYKNVKVLAWVQEEPENMGAWTFLQSEIHTVMQKTDFVFRPVLTFFGRRRRATPAVGIEKLHLNEQKMLVQGALFATADVRV